MKEYIEREIAIETAKDALLYDKELGAYDLAKELEAIPTADVVEVTYCRDCQHWNNDIPYPDEFGCCQKHRLEIMRENDFCSYGIRKDGV